MCPARSLTWADDGNTIIELACDKTTGHAGLHHDPRHGPWKS